MDWIGTLEIVGMIATVIFLGFLIKELRKSIKQSKEGKISDRCDLD